MAEIEDYLSGLDEVDATIIRGAYAVARALLPEVEEGRSYGMPALVLDGRSLLSVMRAKQHFGVYPFSADVVASVVESLRPIDGLTAAKGTLRFPLGAPIPEAVVRRLVEVRAAEIRDTNARKPKARPRGVTQTDQD